MGPTCCLKQGADSCSRVRKYANITAALTHGAFALVITVVGYAGLAPYTLELTRQRADTAALLREYPQLTSRVCGNRTHDNFFEWSACIADSNTTSAGSATERVAKTSHVWLTLTVWHFLASFALTTAAFHALTVVYRHSYDKWIDQRINPARWWEYASTYTTMTVAIFALNQQTDLYLYALLVVSSAAQMIIGFAIEFTNQPPVDNTVDDGAIRLQWEEQTLAEIIWCVKVGRKNPSGDPYGDPSGREDLVDLRPLALVMATGGASTIFFFVAGPLGMANLVSLFTAFAAFAFTWHWVTRAPRDADVPKFVLHWGLY